MGWGLILGGLCVVEGGGGEPGLARAAALGVLGAVCRALLSHPRKEPWPPEFAPAPGDPTTSPSWPLRWKSRMLGL